MRCLAGTPHRKIDISADEDAKTLWKRKAIKNELPLILVDGEPVGTIDELAEAVEYRELDQFLRLDKPVPTSSADDSLLEGLVRRFHRCLDARSPKPTQRSWRRSSIRSTWRRRRLLQSRRRMSPRSWRPLSHLLSRTTMRLHCPARRQHSLSTKLRATRQQAEEAVDHYEGYGASGRLTDMPFIAVPAEPERPPKALASNRP